MTRKNLQSIMNLAWRFVKVEGMTMSNALRIAWKNAKVYQAMCKSTVTFAFRKVDGSTRLSTGTLSIQNIPAKALQFSPNPHKKNIFTQRYFDVEKQDWRSFKRENLILVEGC